ncbi:MAG: tRNA uridine-5-carboxymethylaminomethyl(34) synthesis GTPase MnmE [Pseudohongiellaceae bacterium]
MAEATDTICAVATPAGRGGISIVRISGPLAADIARSTLGGLPAPRYARYGPFLDQNRHTIDIGIALFFPAPDSFTGEDVLELQAHGGPILVDELPQEVLVLGSRLARPGEFSERAFLNNKIDLAQAEAIADLIESNTSQAARSALRSLQGEFSRLINELAEAIIQLRIYVEAAIDFPEEEVDFLDEGRVIERLEAIQTQLQAVFAQARQGALLKEGLRVVIAGEPNAGKSSLLNTLAGQDSAIVTDIPGTTRDTLREHINLDGLPVHIIDTAGLRLSEDLVEQEGIKRAWKEIGTADLILFVEDATNTRDFRQTPIWRQLEQAIDNTGKVIVLRNKIDLLAEKEADTKISESGQTTISLSVKQGLGLDLLSTLIKERAGYSSSTEGGFIARRRHLDALTRAGSSLASAHGQLSSHKSGELVAEDLRQAHQALSEITGEFSSDDLLGKIFASFCIGK